MSVAAHIPVFYEDAVADWERSVAKHVRAGNIMRIYFWMLLGAVLIFLGYELIFGSLIPPLVAIGLISFHCIIFAWITYQYKHLGRSIKRGDLKDVTSDLSGALGEMINPLKKAMHLENEELSVLLNTRDYATSPSVQGYGGRPYLILPLGFLKVLSVEPVFAKTILAHELGHVRQRDIDIHFLSRIIFRMSDRKSVV